WKQNRSNVDEMHFVKAGRNAVLFFAVALSLMAMLSFYWQRYTELPLLSFALGVMAFAYTGLLGVFGAAIFTNRGSSTTVPMSLLGGFMTVLLLQPYVLGDNLGELFDFKLGFAWQILVGTIVAFGVMMIGKEEQHA
ncbi:MAG: sodium:solute symporter, partial [Sulfurovum sp.]